MYLLNNAYSILAIIMLTVIISPIIIPIIPMVEKLMDQTYYKNEKDD